MFKSKPRLLDKGKYICPYCFGSFDKYMFQCLNKRCKEKGERVFAASQGREAECSECKTISYTRVCPHPNCHKHLPDSTLNGEDCIISIVGSRASGKSHFVGILIHEMMRRIAPQYNKGSFEGFDDSLSRYQKVFENQIYSGFQLDLTGTAMNNQDVSLPYIFNYKFKTKRDEIKCYTFVFFDTAGEDLNDLSTMTTVNKYICKSSGIIFLLDPMSIQGVVNQLDKDWVSRASGGLQEHDGIADDIISRVSRLIRNANGMKEEQKIDIPVAAVFSKYDAFEQLVPEDATVRRTSPHCKKGKFDDADRIAVDSEIASLLDSWGARSFTSQLENNYKTYSYFAVSALGLENNPSSGRFAEPHPHRIEDPLLWLMKIGGKLE